jgi:hypothetical protein
MKQKLLITERKLLRRIFRPTKDRDGTVLRELKQITN